MALFVGLGAERSGKTAGAEQVEEVEETAEAAQVETALRAEATGLRTRQIRFVEA